MRKLLLPILVFALVLNSCTDDLTSLNEDPKSTDEVPAEPLFSNAQVSLVTLQSNPSVNFNIFKFIVQYWAQTTYADESNYDFTQRQIPSTYWGQLHQNVLKDLDDASRLLEADELMAAEEKQNKQAQIEIVKVMAWYKLVTTFGDMPYSEALDSENLSPAYDDAETIYTDLLSRLETAVGNLNTGAPGFSSGDVFYNGAIGQWVKLAHSLRMRLAMTVVDNPPSGVNPQAIIEDASPNAFTSNADNAIMGFTSTPPHTNPVWENLIQSGRDDYVAANTLIDQMNSLNDPRRPIHFTEVDTSTEEDVEKWAYVGAEYGFQNTYADFSHMDNEGPDDNDEAPKPIQLNNFEGMVLSYDEIEFLRAEANVRGWLTGTAAQAATHYNNAIEADMQYWSGMLSKYQLSGDEITAGEISTYQTADAPFPVAGSQQDQLNVIATQKWLALYPLGQQAWVDWRRLDHPTFNIANLISSEDEIPVRYPYPVTEQNLNQESLDEATGGDYGTDTRLFWDADYASSVN